MFLPSVSGLRASLSYVIDVSCTGVVFNMFP